MRLNLETYKERTKQLPTHEASWIDSRIKRVNKMLLEAAQFPEMLFEGRPYDEQTAHLRLLQYYNDSIEHGFSDEGRQTILDVATEFGEIANLSVDVMQDNWAKANNTDS